MKKSTGLRMLFFFIVLAFISFRAPALVAAQTSPESTDLIAGQNIDVGEVRVWQDEEGYLWVQYLTDTEWCMTLTHLAVGASLSDIPQARGNPIPGRFPYKGIFDDVEGGCGTEFSFKIAVAGYGSGTTLYIAAHADVRNQENQEETAWAAGLPFDGRNWATYFTYRLNGGAR